MTLSKDSAHSRTIPARRRRQLACGIVLLLAVVAVWWLMTPTGATPGIQPAALHGATGRTAPVPVRAASVELDDLPVYLTALGTATPLSTVLVRSRVDGELIEIAFEEGQTVQAGELLARIDPRSYEVALAEAEGQLQQNQALLENAEGNLELYRGLWEQDSIARQELDNQKALVRQYRGTILIDQARVADAKLQLSFTRITAPVTGRLGLRKVDPGNLISSGDSEGLVTITQMDPISVLFHIPEAELGAVMTGLQSGKPLTVEAWNRTSTELLAVGTLVTADNQIDTATGTIALRAQFDNSPLQLFPNQFVNVRLHLRTLEDARVIPTAAIQYGAPGTYVYVIDESDKVQLRSITEGPSSGQRTAVLAGLEAGEQVVLEGMDRLRAGSSVHIITEPVAMGAASDDPVVPAA